MKTEEAKLYLKVLDAPTLRTLYSLSNAGYFDEIICPISEGKEAVVFAGITKDGEFVAIKVYRVTMKTFQTLKKYLEGDPRAYVGKRRTIMIFQWVRKEFRNLLRAQEVGVRVPTPIAYKKNVLIMEFIGEKAVPAPRAKDKPPKDPEGWFKTIKNWIEDLFLKARLVHGDLSEYNILNFNEEPVVIDWGQGVTLDHPLSLDLLKRDIFNVYRYFSSFGVRVGDPEKFYLKIIEKLE